MAGEMVRVVVIGAGEHATAAHLPSLAEMADVDTVAVCDVDESRREKASADFAIEGIYADYRRMLDAESPDAVYLAVRPQNIHEMALEVLGRGLNLFIEKPPGLTSYQTGCMAAAAEKTEAVTFVGFNRRYAPALVEARKRVEEHGPIDHMVVTFSKFGGPEKPLVYDGIADLLILDAIHAVDMLRWLGGEVEAVRAVTRVSLRDQDSKYVALARFEGDRTGFLNCTWNSGTRTLCAELHGGCSCAFVEVEEGFRFHHAGGAAEVMSAADLAGGDAFHHVRGYFAESRAFIDCVKAGVRPHNDLADALKTMQLAERLYRETM